MSCTADQAGGGKLDNRASGERGPLRTPFGCGRAHSLVPGARLGLGCGSAPPVTALRHGVGNTRGRFIHAAVGCENCRWASGGPP